MWSDLKLYVRALASDLYRDEDGQGLVEYALILSLVSIVAVAVLTSLGTSVINMLSSVANQL